MLRNMLYVKRGREWDRSSPKNLDRSTLRRACLRPRWKNIPGKGAGGDPPAPRQMMHTLGGETDRFAIPELSHHLPGNDSKSVAPKKKKKRGSSILPERYL